MRKEDAVWAERMPSIGGGTMTPTTGGDESTTAFIEEVDRRRYRAKQEGRNKVVTAP